MSENMVKALSSDIQVNHSPEGIRYVFPPRTSIWPPRLVNTRRRSAKCCLLLGLPVALGMFTQAWLRAGPQFVHLFVFIAFGGLITAGYGAAVLLALAGHSEISVRDGMLCETEHIGPFWWTSRRPLADIRSFRIEPAPIHTDGPPNEEAEQLWSILVDCEGAKPLRFVAPCARRDCLEELAATLAGHCRLVAGNSSMAGTAPVVITPDENYSRTHPPAGSQIMVERGDHELTLAVPAAGFRGTAACILIFGLAFAMVAGALIIGAIHRDDPPKQPQHEEWTRSNAIGAGLVCAAVALGTGVFSLSLARRRAVLMVAGKTLSVMEDGLVRSRRREWQRQDLSDVRVGPSSVDINETPVPQLQVYPQIGKVFGLLTGRDAAELEWIAQEVRRALELPDLRDPAESPDVPKTDIDLITSGISL